MINSAEILVVRVVNKALMHERGAAYIVANLLRIGQSRRHCSYKSQDAQSDSMGKGYSPVLTDELDRSNTFQNPRRFGVLNINHNLLCV